MCYRDGKARLLEQVKHNHGINATTNGQQNAIGRFTQAVALNMVQKLL